MSGVPDPFWSGLRWADIAAVVGAFAWLPHIVNYFRRPKVTLIPGGKIEVGFTGLGPIFNPSLAFRTQRRDALVTGVRFAVRHERGQTAEFQCTQLSEQSGVTRFVSGDAAVHQRIHAAIAAVVTTSAIVERIVVCQERRVLDRMDTLMVAYETAVRHALAANPQPWPEQIVQSAESNALRDFWIESFFWQAGTYSVTAFATVAELRIPVKLDFSFALSEAQVELLRGNRAYLELELRRIGGAPNVQDTTKLWQWIYPITKTSPLPN